MARNFTLDLPCLLSCWVSGSNNHVESMNYEHLTLVGLVFDAVV